MAKFTSPTNYSNHSNYSNIELNERLSAWMDDEEVKFDPSSVQTSYGRQVWQRYHMIGDVMRNNSLAITTSEVFYARLSKNIDAEPAFTLASKSKKMPVLALSTAIIVGVLGYFVLTNKKTDLNQEIAPVMEVPAPVPVPNLNMKPFLQEALYTAKMPLLKAMDARRGLKLLNP